MKVYVLTVGDYSRYAIIGIFSTKEKAEKATGGHTLFDTGADKVNEIEEWIVDAKLDPKMFWDHK